MEQVTAIEPSDGGRRGDRRERLRDFQTQLLAKMQGVQAGNVASSNQLGVLIGETRYLLNLREAGEILSVGAISPVPLTRDWYLGLVNLRGNLIGVVDLPRFRGQARTEIDANSRVVAFAGSLSFNAGLLVNRVLGLRNVADMNISEQEPEGQSGWLRQSFVDNSNQIWHEISVASLIQDGDFLHIGV